MLDAARRRDLVDLALADLLRIVAELAALSDAERCPRGLAGDTVDH